MKRCWKQQKKAEKSVNLRVNFGKNKKASRIKALRELTMKRLTDFFGEKGWKTGKLGYNENRKRSKYCCWTVPMRDWNLFSLPFSWYFNSWTVPMRDWNMYVYPYGENRNKYICWTVPMRDWNDLAWKCLTHTSEVEPYLWEIETFRVLIKLLR